MSDQAAWDATVLRALTHACAGPSRLNPGGTYDALTIGQQLWEFGAAGHEPVVMASLARLEAAGYVERIAASYRMSDAGRHLMSEAEPWSLGSGLMQSIGPDGQELPVRREAQGARIDIYPGDGRTWLWHACHSCGHERLLPQHSHGHDLGCQACDERTYAYVPIAASIANLHSPTAEERGSSDLSC